MRESLRLSPTATARTVAAREDVEIIGGDGDALNPANKKYAIKNGVPIVAHTHQTQMDPRCWGENAELFQPERMLDGKFDAMPVGSLRIVSSLLSILTFDEASSMAAVRFWIARMHRKSCSLYDILGLIPLLQGTIVRLARGTACPCIYHPEI